MGASKISVIIPVYNDEEHLEKCLKSVFDSDYTDFEVIVVNDASTDNSLQIAKRFPCKIVNLDRNSGVANARNKGADIAEGEILVFLDSDIVFERDTLSRFAQVHKDPDIKICHCQIYPRSLTKGFIPDLLAITWNYYNKLMGRNPTFIPTEAFSIYKDVFDKIGRFNIRFKSSGGEEFEIGSAIERHGYKIYHDPSFHIHHHFQKFWPRCKTLLRRSYVYGGIVLRRNFKLDQGHGTLKEGINALLSIAGIISLTISIFINSLVPLFLATIVLQVFLDIGLYNHIRKEKGIFFSLVSIPVNYFWYFLMGLGVLGAALEYSYQKVLAKPKTQSGIEREKC